MYDMKALYEAHSVEEAVKLRLEHPEAQIIAGGTDVLVQMREGRRAGKELISIHEIDSMRGISIDEHENIRIGSLTTFSHITRDPIIIEKMNVLGEAVDMVGGPQIRNMGTIGGNTCNGVTSADSASTLHAWEAIVELTGVNGKRCLPIRDFYLKAGVVDIRAAEGEIQTALLIPRASWENTKGFYIKYGMRNAMEIATTGCSVNVRLSEDKKRLTASASPTASQAPCRCAPPAPRPLSTADPSPWRTSRRLRRPFLRTSSPVTRGVPARRSASTSPWKWRGAPSSNPSNAVEVSCNGTIQTRSVYHQRQEGRKNGRYPRKPDRYAPQ